MVKKLLAFLEKAKKQTLAAENVKNKEHPLATKFEKIESEVKKWIPIIKNWEAKLVERLKELEQHIDEGVFDSDHQQDKGAELILQKLEIINQSVESIKNLFGQSSKKSSDRQHEQKQFEKADGELASKMYVKFQRCYDSLESLELKACYLCLSIFPENSIIKKKPLIYWWIAEGLISKTNGLTAEEVAEEVFEELIEEGFLIPKPDHPSPSVNSCMIHPLARRTLMFLAKSVHFFDFDSEWGRPVNGFCRAFLFSGTSHDLFASTTVDQDQDEDEDQGQGQETSILGKFLTVFNLTEEYLQLGDWLSKLNNVRVLQLGRWQHNVKHHIEVENQDSTFNPEMKKNEEDVYLNGLGTQESLRYLSLRGVSRMTSLPPSVANLSSLEILDLRDCQGLEKLAFDISSLENLTHLDVSECYLLESMPKGIEKLSSLQVLKGFIIGNARKDPCKVSDLARLEQLRKLSVRIGNEATEDEGFKNFKDFKALKILVISWSGANVTLQSFTAPPNLKKLELKCAPISHFEWLNPDQLKSLEKLYIRGGKLSTLTLHGKNEYYWKVKILILKYLKEFNVISENLRQGFPHLEYLDKVGCHIIENDIQWRI